MKRLTGLIFLILAIVSTAKPTSKLDCAAKLAACYQDSNANKTVCGEDNQTYSNRCQIIKQKCDGVKISIKHKGPCRDAQPCEVSLRYAQKMSKPARGTRFMPKCRVDGTYAPVQCHSNSGCWCVTAQGKRIPNTSVRGGRPNCGKREKSDTTRRSSVRGGHRNREECTRVDRAQFIINLINVFSAEYDRMNPSKPQITPADKDTIVIKWKFSMMDRDHDDRLNKPEYRQIRKLIIKVIEPKRCAKTFARQCDLDHDDVITRQEWMSCINDDTHSYEGGGRAPGANKGSTYDNDHGDDDDDDYQLHGPTGGKRADRRLHRRGPMHTIQKTVPTQLLQISTSRVSSQGIADDMERNRDEREGNDCISDKKAQLEEHKNGDPVYYLPDCMPDGRYQRMQCYRSTGYCWCVHEDTGNPIPGTSVKDKYPNCDALPTPSRPMKGCSEPKKVQFLRDLMEFLKVKMSSINGTAVMGKWPTSKEEQIATWSFVMLDKNQNKVLERNEWKTFRQLVMDNIKLQHCGKKLPRYCDVNYDQEISMTEWINCLNAERSFNAPETTSIENKRKGKNPLDSYLKAD